MSFVVIGEALVDILVGADGARVERPGGSCLNVAVAASRLGVDTTLVTQLGDDDRGDLVRRHLDGSDVALDESRTPSGRTSTATAHIGDDGAATYEFDLEWAPPTLAAASLPDRMRALHIGSLGTTLSPGARAVADLVESVGEQPGVIVSYDPNVRPSFIDDPAAALAGVRSWAARADLVKLSDEDCAHLSPGVDPGEVAASLLGGRTRLVVLTRGGDGASAYATDLEVSVPAPQAQVVDTVGAGDTFSAALVSALLVEDRLTEDAWHREERVVRRVLTSAAAAAAVTVSRPGADPPRVSELAEWPCG